MLIAAAALCQIASNFARPLISYKVLALGGDSISVGLASAPYALVPSAAALWLGRISDQRESLRGIAAVGSLLLAAGPFVLSLSPSLLLVAVASALLGMGQLCFTIAGQSAIARFIPPGPMDAAFGWFTASLAEGQMVGPLLAGLTRRSSGGVPAVVRLADANAALLIAGIISVLAVPFAAAGNPRGCIHRLPPAPAGPSHPLEPARARHSKPCGSRNNYCVAAQAFRVFMDGRNTVGCRGLFLGMGQPVTMALVTQSVPPPFRGATLALRLLSNRVGQVTLPAAAGLLAAPVGASGALWMSCAVLAAACVRWPGDKEN